MVHEAVIEELLAVIGDDDHDEVVPETEPARLLEQHAQPGVRVEGARRVHPLHERDVGLAQRDAARVRALRPGRELVADLAA